MKAKGVGLEKHEVGLQVSDPFQGPSHQDPAIQDPFSSPSF